MRDDPALLSLSDLWSTQALEEHNIERAFRSIHLGITEATVGNISLYHTASGVHCVRALIAQAMGDTATLRQALSDFAAVSRLPCDNLDLTLGKSSILIGCTILLEAIGSNISSTNTDILKYLGSKILDDIWTRIKNYEHVGNSPELPYLGLAHGWAGILYAILSWCLVSGQALPHTIKQRLDELANLAKSCDKEICWPLQIGRAESWPGWCHGSAGYVHLWVLADQVLNDSRYLDLAKGAAWHTLTHAEKSSGQLCCGLSGQSYALLTLYRHTHDEKWLEPALMLGSKAVARATSSGLHIHSLYKGDVGIALLAADLANPGKSCVPMFEVHL
jgi:serine/threonine-protein kinase